MKQADPFYLRMLDGQAREQVAARLLELCFSRDDRVAVDAAKLLIDAQLVGLTTRINDLDGVPPEKLRALKEAADDFIKKRLADGGSAGEQPIGESTGPYDPA